MEKNMLYTSSLVIGLENQLDDPSFLLRAADETGTGLELFLHAHHPTYDAQLDRAQAWLGQRPRTMHGPFIGVEAASPKESASHAHMLDAYRRAFENAKKLESSRIVFHTNQRVIEAAEKAQAQEMCIASIRELLAMAGEYGVQLLIENLGIQKRGVCLFDEEEFLQLIDRFPQAGCLIDMGHLHIAGWNAERVLSALGSRVIGYHFHNNDGVNDEHRRITDGTLDYASVMALYRRYTPEAGITLEYGDAYGITWQDVVEDLRFVQGMLA